MLQICIYQQKLYIIPWHFQTVIEVDPNWITNDKPTIALVVIPKNIDVCCLYSWSSWRSRSNAEVELQRWVGVTIWLARFRPRLSIAAIKTCMDGSSLCSSKLKYVNIDTALVWNISAGSRRGLENHLWRRWNLSSTHSSLRKYDFKLPNFFKILFIHFSKDNQRTETYSKTLWYSWSENWKYSFNFPFHLELLSNQ